LLSLRINGVTFEMRGLALGTDSVRQRFQYLDSVSIKKMGIGGATLGRRTSIHHQDLLAVEWL